MDIQQPFPPNVHPDDAASGDARIPLSRKLDGLSRARPESCIFRVHKHLREVNNEAYEPDIIAIGPYHRNKDCVQLMEDHKLRYLHSLLQLKNENVGKYLLAIGPLEQQVRDFYAEPLSLTSDELAEMMVLDGCFIIQLVRQYNRVRSHVDANDPIFKLAWIEIGLKRDLMLFENQIPFFILSKLFGMIENSPSENRLTHLILDFFAEVLPDPLKRWSTPKEYTYSHGKIKHLLDLMHKHWEPPLTSLAQGDSCEAVNDIEDGNTMPCATELRDAGVKFKRKETNGFFDISFNNGIFKIPPFITEDRTESFLRNLIAYEQYCGGSRPSYVTDYVKFLDYLISSSEDVDLLCRYGILQNLLGDSEVVAQLFNTITNSVGVSLYDFHYAGIFKSVNGYCNKRRNRWMAKLRRNYLNSPWGVISLVIASILLLLTVTQTIFTIFPRG